VKVPGFRHVWVQVDMAISEEDRTRQRAVIDVLDRPRAWVRLQVRVKDGVVNHYQEMLAERVFYGDQDLPTVDITEVGASEAAQLAIAGLREMADKMERDLTELFIEA
jgi:hypothetical protein